MPVTVGTICYRHASLTPEAFRRYFEETHVPLLERLCFNVSATSKPLSYRRNYTAKLPGGTAPFMLHGDASKLDWDAFSEVTFRDMKHFQEFGQAYAKNKDEINADEKRFFDVERLLVAVYETEGVEA